MNKNETITIIKLGGSCFSDKQEERSFFPEVVHGICEQLVEVSQRYIIVHGGGSYGHPIAKRYGIHLGRQKNIADQVVGFCKTHEVMVELNQAIINIFLNYGIPACPVQPSSSFVYEKGKVKHCSIDPIDAMIEQGIVPVLYGDAVIDADQGFRIMSGDAIVVELANRLKHAITRIVYLLDVDGLFNKDPKANKDAKLIPEIFLKDGNLYVQEKDNLVPLVDIAGYNAAIDVTGGIHAKIKELSRLQRKNISPFLINGRSKFITSLLQGSDVPCTKINISDMYKSESCVKK